MREADPRRSRRRLLVTVLAVLPVLGALGAWGYGQWLGDRPTLPPLAAAPPDDEAATASVDVDPDAAVLTAGSVDLEGLAAALSGIGHDEVLTRDEEAWLLDRTLVVSEEAALTVDGARLRLRSTPDTWASLEVRGGHLTVRDSVVTSWDPAHDGPDEDPRDGRAYVLARDGATMDVLGSQMRMLGYDENERWGVSWRTAGTGGEVDRSVFSGNWYGLYTWEAEPMHVRRSVFEHNHHYGLDPHSGSRDFLIEDNVFRHNGAHGMILAEECSDAVVRDNVAYGNDDHGLVVFDRSNDVAVRDNTSYDNGGSGVDVNGSARTVVRDNLVHGNGAGVTVQGGSRDTRIGGNRIAGNTGDGVRVSGGSSVDRVAGNLIDYNFASGVHVDDGEVTVGPDNELLDNTTGIYLTGAAGAVSVTGNRIDDNVDDGIHLTGTDEITVERNRLRDNGQAAFSVEEAGAAKPYLDFNVVGDHNDGAERVRGGG